MSVSPLHRRHAGWGNIAHVDKVDSCQRDHGDFHRRKIGEPTVARPEQQAWVYDDKL